jgi:hypothetical protein
MEKEFKDRLKKLARNTISAELDLEDLMDIDKEFSEDIFKEKRGVFVTLEIEGQLRGCIGNILPVYPLAEAIMRNAYEAAFEDPRFGPLTKGEFKDTDIEISVLTEPEKLEYKSAEDLLDKLHPGKDGVVIQKGMYKSTYLPQVWEDLPNKEEFLSSLCMKAGLDSDEWEKRECKIYTYEVEKF